MSAAPDVSVVVIGRNEGERLRRCLQSVRQAQWDCLHWELIYVDSHSSDGSVATARQCGAQVLTLGDAPPTVIESDLRSPRAIPRRTAARPSS